MRLYLAVVAVVCLSGGAAVAEPAAVEDLIRRANDLRRKDKDPAALPLYQKAYELAPSPRTAAQLALVEAALGYWLPAEQHLKEALVSTRNPWLIRNRPKLKQTLASVQAAIGEIEISGSPPGAEVIVNSQRAGVLPLAAPVRAGEGAAKVVLRDAGHKEAMATTTVRGGQRTTVHIALERGTTKLGVDGLIAEGVDLRKQGQDAKALPLFQKAHELEPSPRTAAQLGLVEASLGLWLPSETHLKEAMSAVGTDSWVRRYHSELRKTVESVEKSIGEVEVVGGPVGAEVKVNGKVAGLLPLQEPVRVAAGTAGVEVTAVGYRAASTSTRVAGGKRAVVRLVLQREP